MPKDLAASMDYYNMSISKTRDPILRSKCFYAIGDIYRNGTPPDAPRAIDYYLRANAEDAIMDIVKIYEHGLHPFYLPDKMIARKILNTLLFDPVSKAKLSVTFRQSISELSKELGNLSYEDVDKIAYGDREYKPLPSNIDVTIIESIRNAQVVIMTKTPIKPEQTRVITPTEREALQRNARRERAITLTQREAPHRTARRERIITPDIDAIIDNLFIHDNEMETHGGAQATQGGAQVTIGGAQVTIGGAQVTLFDRIPDQVIKNDSQNVHSSTLNNAAKNALDTIEKSSQLYHSFDNNVDNFLNSLNTTKQYELRKVLATLNDKTHSRFDKSEKDVFNLVWSRINDPINSDRKQDMIDVLAQNIESGAEHGMVVCSTGKIMRMIGSLDAMDKENVSNLRPEWAIKEEMAQTAAHVRNDIFESGEESHKIAYEALNPTLEQQTRADEMAETMRDKFIQNIDNDYVETKILTKQAADVMMAPYLDSF
jgi:hypothetical protein